MSKKGMQTNEVDLERIAIEKERAGVGFNFESYRDKEVVAESYEIQEIEINFYELERQHEQAHIINRKP